MLQDLLLAGIYQRAQAPLERAIDCCAHINQSELDAAEQKIAKEREVTEQAVPRMLKSGGPILLKGEMADPREAVPEDRRTDEEPRIARDQRQRKYGQVRLRCSDK